jgi:hypothetical protein
MRMFNCLLIFLALSFSCKREPAANPNLLTYIKAASSRQIELIAKSPEIGKAAEKLIERMATDPELLQAGERLLAPLLSSPKIAAGGSSIITKVQEDPEFIREIQTLMTNNPNSTPDQIGALMEKRIEKIVEQEAFQKVMEDFVRQLAAKPEVAKQVESLQQEMIKIESPDLSQYDALITRKMIELNNGVLPANEKEVNVVFEKLMTLEKGSLFYKKFFESPVVQKSFTQATIKILQDKDLTVALIQSTEALLAEPTITKKLAATILVLTGEDPSAETLKTEMEHLLEEPLLETQLAYLLGELNKENSRSILKTALQTLVKDPSFQEMFADSFLKD